MATNEREFVFEEIECFAAELYDFIWSRHRFRSESLEKSFVNQLTLTIEEGDEDTCDLYEEIVGAVFCSQYLFREYCECVFKRYKTVAIDTDVFFYECVFEVIKTWFQNRSNVFIKFIDAAAIIAEAILYCDGELKMAIDFNKASRMFSIFFGRYLQDDFSTNGAWEGLYAEVSESYRQLHLTLSPFIYNMKLPYEKLQHDCYLMKNLKKSPMVFPLLISTFCNECKFPSDAVFCGCNHEEIFDKTSEKVLADHPVEQEDTSQNVSHLKSEHFETSSKDNSEMKDHIPNEDCFQYLLIGKQEQEVEAAGEIKKKKPKKKKRKSKQKKSGRLSCENVEQSDL